MWGPSIESFRRTVCELCSKENVCGMKGWEEIKENDCMCFSISTANFYVVISERVAQEGLSDRRGSSAPARSHTLTRLQSDTSPRGGRWKEFLNTSVMDHSCIFHAVKHTLITKQINCTFTWTLINLDKIYLYSLPLFCHPAA